jgi:penicillin-binding protein 1A
MASAYATLAAGGIYSKPISILRVQLASGAFDKDSGWGKPDRVRVIDDGVAAEVTKILSENIRYGTAAAAELGRPDAAKTGTTENHADAWLCGYTPNLSTTVWMGYPQAEIPMLSVHGISVTGGSFPAQIWHLYMSTALQNVRAYEFPIARTPPSYKSFTRGDYAISGGYAPTPTTTETRAQTATRPATTAAVQTAPQPPPVTETTPVVTEPPPQTTPTPTTPETVTIG